MRRRPHRTRNWTSRPSCQASNHDVVGARSRRFAALVEVSERPGPMTSSSTRPRWRSTGSSRSPRSWWSPCGSRRCWSDEAQVQHVADDLARLAPLALGVDGALERVADLETTLGLLAVVAALWPATAYGSALARVLDRVAGDRVATGLRGRGAALCSSSSGRCSCWAAWWRATPALPRSVTRRWRSRSVSRSPLCSASRPQWRLSWSSTRPSPERRPLASDTQRSGRRRWGHRFVVGGLCRLPAPRRQLRAGYASDALAAVLLLAVWLFAANAALLVGYRVARRQTRP